MPIKKDVVESLSGKMENLHTGSLISGYVDENTGQDCQVVF